MCLAFQFLPATNPPVALRIVFGERKKSKLEVDIGLSSSAFLHDLDETLTKERDLGTPNSGQYEKEQTSGQRKGLVKS